MIVKDPDKTNDLERTIEAVDESRAIIGHTLSAIGFQGDPRLLVIDELHFVLRPAFVTLACGSSIWGNLLAQDRNVLDQQLATTPPPDPNDLTSNVEAADAKIWHRAFRFDAIQPPTGSRSPLHDLLQVRAAHEFCRGQWKLILYYKDDPLPEPSITESATRLRQALLQSIRRHFSRSIELLQKYEPSPGQDNDSFSLRHLLHTITVPIRIIYRIRHA